MDSLQAYFKMQNVLVDDRRIWVDLYVSVHIQFWLWLMRYFSSQLAIRIKIEHILVKQP